MSPKVKSSVFVALVAVLITAASVWFTQRPTAPKQTNWAEVEAEAHSGGYRLLTTAELAERYRRAPDAMLLVDTRQGWEYRTGHMAGAVNFSLEPTWWARWRKASELKKFLGPDKERFLVFY